MTGRKVADQALDQYWELKDVTREVKVGRDGWREKKEKVEGNVVKKGYEQRTPYAS